MIHGQTNIKCTSKTCKLRSLALLNEYLYCSLRYKFTSRAVGETGAISFFVSAVGDADDNSSVTNKNNENETRFL
jgi:hypothetical protein